jgi:hypothetical protein
MVGPGQNIILHSLYFIPFNKKKVLKFDNSKNVFALLKAKRIPKYQKHKLKIILV